MKNSDNYAKYSIVLALIVLTSGAVLLGHFGRRLAPPSTPTHQALDARTKARVSAAYAQLPIHFEANRGQTDAQVKFRARGQGYNLFLTSNEAVLALRKGGNPRSAVSHSQSAVVRMKLVGAQAQPHAMGLDKLPGNSNYLIGKDRRQWRTNVPTYARVGYEGVYPGVDLIYHGNQRQLEYDFVVAPGADSAAIALRFEGANKIEVDTQGDLVLHTAGGQVRQRKPFIYQEVNGVRQEIAGGYTLKDEHQVSFQLGAYDAARPLVIDPVLLYSTYLGGSGVEDGFDIAVDSSGSIYVAGRTFSINFPTTLGSFDPACGGAGGCNSELGDAFVAKLNLALPPSGQLVYSTYLGGSGDDVVAGLALKPNCSVNCNVYLTGATTSPDFPTQSAFQSTYGGGGYDAFATVLNDTGNALVYSTYLGGSAPLQANDEGLSIAVDSSGHGYVTGYASSNNFPTTSNAYRQTNANPGAPDAFVARFDPSQIGMSSLVYSTYLGGGDHSSGGTFGDFGQRIAADDSGNAYVTGITGSGPFPPNPDLIAFPTTMDALQPNYGGGVSDAFVTKLNTNAVGAASLVYSTFLGGSGTDQGGGIAADASGVYVTGNTTSTASSFPPITPVQPTPFQVDNHGDNDVFVAKLNPPGSGLIYFTYLGGGLSDLGNDIAVDAAGQAYITGNTASTDFPTANPIQSVLLGSGDFFVTKLNATGSALVYSTYFGGSGHDGSKGLALDSSGNAYVIGFAASTDFPTTANARQPSTGGSFDAFVVKIGEAPDLSITKTDSPDPVVTGSNVTYTITVTNNGPNAASSVTVTDDLPVSTAFVSCSATGGGICGGSGNNRTVNFTSLSAGASATITLAATVNCSVTDGTVISNTATVSSAAPDPNPNNNSATAMTTASNPPPIITCPANLVVTAPAGAGSMVVNYPAPTVADNCPGATFVCSSPSGASFPIGVTTVTCTATDAASRQANCIFKIAVNGTLFAVRDSYLRGGSDNINEGANERLRIQNSGPNRALVRFDLSGIPTAGLQSATLVLNIGFNSSNWGATGRLVDAHRLLADWTEGNGRNQNNGGGLPLFRGTGEGVTWNCAKDTDISNQQPNCGVQWNGGNFAPATAPGILHTNGLLGNVAWNVTADVSAGASFGWLIKKREEGQNGQARYYSREGAAGNPGLVPRLALVYAP